MNDNARPMGKLMGVAVLLLLVVMPVSGQAVLSEDSVFRIHASRVRPDMYRPWQSRSPVEVKGTGFLIEGGRILTNAHVVAYAEEVLIEAEGLPQRVPAEVLFLDEGIDLALLELEDPAAIADREPIRFASELPADGDPVSVLGYPQGGETLSSTQGVVSRVEYESFYYSEMGLRVQIDAAVNPGNSGGPAFVEGECIGVVFSRIEEADNIGYVISAFEVQRFLDDIGDGALDGKPYLNAYTAPAENPTRRSFLGLASDQSGVVVIDSRTEGLEQNDVLLEVAGHSVDNRGYAEFLGQRLLWQAVADAHVDADRRVPATVWRDGAELETSIVMTLDGNWLFDNPDEWRPEYFVHGPFVFTAVSQRFARIAESPAWGRNLAYRDSPIISRLYDTKRFPGEQIVVLAAPPFPHAVMRGYEDIDLAAHLHSVNGTEVKNLRHALELIEGVGEGLITLEFSDAFSDRILVFDAEDLADSTEQVLDRHSIRRDRSAGLR